MKASDLIRSLDLCFAAKLSVMIWGKPGVGKSAIIAWMVTQKKAWKLWDFRLVLRDTVDMRGVPFVDKDGRTQWAVPAEFPKEGEVGIWFLDEANAAHPQVQVVAYQLTHDRAVGEYKVPDGVHIVLAGNYDTDGAVVHKMSSALSSRIVHLDLDVDKDDWLDWAQRAGVSDMVRAFIKFRSNLLHMFDKESAKQRAYPCPRTWERVDRIVKQNPPFELAVPLYNGTVGPGAATEFAAFSTMWTKMPDIDDIIANPKTAPIPDDKDTGIHYAIATCLSSRMTVKNIGKVLTYLERMPVEFNVMATTDAVKRAQELQTTPEFAKWCAEHVAMMTPKGTVVRGKAAA